MAERSTKPLAGARILILTALAAIAWVQSSQGQVPQIEVFTTEYSLTDIAVPTFVAKNSNPRLEKVFSEIISNDLHLSGFFRLPDNPQFVEQTAKKDLAANTIHFDDWDRLGATYLVRGEYEVTNTDSGPRLDVEVHIYDTGGKMRLSGLQYPGYNPNNPRAVAHLVSSDIISRITGREGIAHTKILFVRQDGFDAKKQRVTEIFMMDADGQNIRQMTNDQSISATPAWGINATEVYYTTWRDNNPDLAGMYIDGTRTWFISREPLMNVSPNWSPAAKKILLSISKSGNSEIYQITRYGALDKQSPPRRLTTTAKSTNNVSPCWDPTGKRIAFASDRTGNPHIWVMDADGRNQKRVTRRGTHNVDPSWSPDGETILFTSRIDGIYQICSISPDGSDYKQLTSGPRNSEDPSWAPNGWLIAYTAETNNSKDIHVMFRDGRHLARLTSGAESKSPAWSPMLRR